MLFNNTLFFKINIFNILTGQERDMTELKLVWPVNTTGHRSKIILSLVTQTGRVKNKGEKSQYENT